MPKDAINVYVCQECRGLTVTIDRDEGVTPFMIGCHAGVGKCDGTAYSSFYKPRMPHGKPEWEWYKASPREARSLGEAEHIEKGGLMLRKIGSLRHVE